MGLRGYKERIQLKENLSLLLCENFSLKQKKVREKLAEIVFETLDFSNFQFTDAASNILHS